MTPEMRLLSLLLLVLGAGIVLVAVGFGLNGKLAALGVGIALVYASVNLIRK